MPTSAKKNSGVRAGWIVWNIFLFAAGLVSLGLLLAFLYPTPRFESLITVPWVRPAVVGWIGFSGLITIFALYGALQRREPGDAEAAASDPEAGKGTTRIRLFELSSLFKVASNMDITWSLDDVMDIAVQRVVATMKAQHVSIMLLDEETDMLETFASYGVEAEYARKGRQKLGTGIAGVVAERKEAMLLTEKNPTPELKKDPKVHRNITSAISVPLVAGDQCVGVMNVNRIDYPEDFKEDHREMLEMFGRHLGITVKRARSMQKLAARAESLESDLRTASDRIGEVDKLREIFVSTASQELRAPLTALRSSIDALRRSDPSTLGTERGQTLLAELVGSCDVLERVCNDIIDVSRVERGEVVLRVRPASLNDLAAKSVATLRPIAQRYGITLLESYDSELPELNLDEIKLRHPFVQLLAHMLQASPEGAQISVKTSVAGDRALLEIADRLGEGSPASEDGVTKWDLAAGLGLINRTVELHGGEVRVDDQEGIRTVIIQLPTRSDTISIYSKVA